MTVDRLSGDDCDSDNSLVFRDYRQMTITIVTREWGVGFVSLSDDGDADNIGNDNNKNDNDDSDQGSKE